MKSLLPKNLFGLDCSNILEEQITSISSSCSPYLMSIPKIAFSEFAVLLFLLLVLCNPVDSFGQLTKFKNLRTWSDSSGNFEVTAKLTSANSDEAVIVDENDKSMTVKFKKLSVSDQKFVQNFSNAAFLKLKSDARECVYASDALTLYEDYVTEGLVGSSNRLLIESKIEALKKYSELQAIIVGDDFLPKAELPAQKNKTRDMVNDWITKVGLAGNAGKDQKLLRAAIKGDPTSLDAAIILALYFDVHNAEHETAQRHLDNAVKRGMKFLPIATPNDKTNVLVALNNLAVSYARIDRIPKALKLWMKANEVSNASLPPEATHNIAKVNRMVNQRNSGLSTDADTRKALAKFSGLTNSQGGTGGWKLMCPKDCDGKTVTNLPFVLMKGYSVLSGGSIEDRRCVKCEGASRILCPSRVCKRGIVSHKNFGPRIMQTPNGPIDLGYGFLGVEKKACTNCRGNGVITCPYCSRGVQN